MCDPVSIGVGTAVAGGAKAIAGHQDKKNQASMANKAKGAQYKAALDQRYLDTTQRYNVFGQELNQYNQSGVRAREALSRGFSQAQNQLNDVYDSAAFSTQNRLIESEKALGRIAARGVSGQSAARAAQSQLADFGRNQAILERNLLGAQNRYLYDVEGLRQRYNSNRAQAYGKVGIAPVAGLAPTKPIYSKGPSNLSLIAGLGQAAVSGFGAYNSLKASSTGLEGMNPPTDLPSTDFSTPAPGGWELPSDAMPSFRMPSQ